MDGTPLPPALSGTKVQRLIEIDQALLYLVTGSLDWLVLYEPLVQTGALTPETAKNALSVALEVYLNERDFMTPVGGTMLWHTETPPDRWVICDGTGILKADYPELYDLWGDKYGSSPDFFGTPDLRSRIPYGADFDIELDEAYGEATHLLTTAEIPAHNHGVTDPGHVHQLLRSGGGGGGIAAATFGTFAAPTNTPVSNNTTGISIQNTGGGTAHNNMPPVRGVNFIAYGGRAP